MRLLIVATLALLLMGCGSGDGDTSPTGEAESDALFPTIVDATATQDGEDTWAFSVTVSSPYDSPEQYADAWRVLGRDGTEFGVRILTHDHAGEQPFTRSASGVQIPTDVDTVTIEGRDLINGWGGVTFELDLER
jgi:hypothetical protein